MSLSKNVFIVAAKRTAFGKFGGKVKDLSATDLQEWAAKAAIAQSKVPVEKFDSVKHICCLNLLVYESVLRLHLFFIYLLRLLLAT
jgi:acetyl-CoA acetyltransferase